MDFELKRIGFCDLFLSFLPLGYHCDFLLLLLRSRFYSQGLTLAVLLFWCFLDFGFVFRGCS